MWTLFWISVCFVVSPCASFQKEIQYVCVFRMVFFSSFSLSFVSLDADTMRFCFVAFTTNWMVHLACEYVTKCLSDTPFLIRLAFVSMQILPIQLKCVLYFSLVLPPNYDFIRVWFHFMIIGFTLIQLPLISSKSQWCLLSDYIFVILFVCIFSVWSCNCDLFSIWFAQFSIPDYELKADVPIQYFDCIVNFDISPCATIKWWFAANIKSDF